MFWEGSATNSRRLSLVCLPLECLEEEEEEGEEEEEAMMTDIGFLYCQGASVSAETFMSYYRPDPRVHTPNLIPKIESPVLVIVGSEDEVVTGLEEAVAPLVESGAAQMTVVDGADHFFLDFYAEDAADAVDEFIMSQ